MKPDLPKLFPELKSINNGQLETSSAIFSHAERVMQAVENAVSALNDAVSFTAYLEELGRRHKVRALKPDYLEVSFNAFFVINYELKVLLRSDAKVSLLIQP